MTRAAKTEAVTFHPEFVRHFPSAKVVTFRSKGLTTGQTSCRDCGRPHVEGTDVVATISSLFAGDSFTLYHCVACACRSDNQRHREFVKWGERIDEKRKQQVKDNGGKCLKCSKCKPRRGHFWCNKCLGA